MTTVKILKKIPDSALTPSSIVFSTLLNFFTKQWDFICKPEGEDWYTETRYPLRPRNFEQYWLNPRLILGVRPDQYTKFGAIDLDSNSSYNPFNNPDKFRQIIRLLNTIGIYKAILLRSSNSGGVHLFFFLPKEINSFHLASLLSKTLIEAGLQIKAGQLEIFPNTKKFIQKGQGVSLYNGIRLPLQPRTGAAILDSETFEELPGGIEYFVELMVQTSTQQNFKRLKAKLKPAYHWYLTQKSGKKDQGDHWEQDIEYRLKEGFTAPGQTNNLLKDIGNLGRVHRGINNLTQLTKFIEERITNLPGYQDFCGHQHEITKRCRDWAKCIIQNWSPYRSYPDRQQNYQGIWQEQENLSGQEPIIRPKRFTGKYSQTNQLRYETTHLHLATIIEAYPLKSMPRPVMKRLKFINKKRQEMFGLTFSRNTLSKPEYLRLWHPKYVPSKPSSFLRMSLWQIINNLLTEILLVLETKMTQLKTSSQKHKTSTLQSSIDIPKVLPRSIGPCSCNMPRSKVLEQSVTQITSGIDKNDRTLMKCLLSFPPYLVSNTQVLTSSVKLDFIQKAKSKSNNQYFYNGPVLNSRRATTRKQNLQELIPGTIVKISSEIHSTSYRDDSSPLMVYVYNPELQPKKNYPVLFDSLIKVDNFDSYLSAVYLLIKDFILAIGKHKTDFLNYLQNQYGVDSIISLSPTEIFQVFQHYKTLYLDNFLEQLPITEPQGFAGLALPSIH